MIEKARIELKKSNGWLRAIILTTEIRKTTFPVFVYKVRIKDINTSD
jgi:hypothetical protein